MRNRALSGSMVGSRLSVGLLVIDTTGRKTVFGNWETGNGKQEFELRYATKYKVLVESRFRSLKPLAIGCLLAFENLEVEIRDMSLRRLETVPRNEALGMRNTGIGNWIFVFRDLELIAMCNKEVIRLCG